MVRQPWVKLLQLFLQRLYFLRVSVWNCGLQRKWQPASVIQQGGARAKWWPQSTKYWGWTLKAFWLTGYSHMSHLGSQLKFIRKITSSWLGCVSDRGRPFYFWEEKMSIISWLYIVGEENVFFEKKYALMFEENSSFSTLVLLFLILEGFIKTETLEWGTSCWPSSHFPNK